MPRATLAIPVARAAEELSLLAGMANRRGLVAGATGTSVAKSAVRAAGTQLGREIMRGVLGSLFGGGGRRR